MKINAQILSDPEMIVKKYGDTVYKVAFSRMKNKEDSEDIFQEVFLRLVRSKTEYESWEHLKAWLIRVTINCCNSHFSSAHQRYSADPEYFTEPSYVTQFHESDILELVFQLPEKYRTVIHLFYYEDLSIEDIAKILDTKTGTVKSQLSRGRSVLKGKLQGGVL